MDRLDVDDVSDLTKRLTALLVAHDTSDKRLWFDNIGHAIVEARRFVSTYEHEPTFHDGNAAEQSEESRFSRNRPSGTPSDPIRGRAGGM